MRLGELVEDLVSRHRLWTQKPNPVWPCKTCSLYNRKTDLCVRSGYGSRPCVVLRELADQLKPFLDQPPTVEEEDNPIIRKVHVEDD